MLNNSRIVFDSKFCVTLASVALFAYSSISMAWGPDGQSTIGILAINQLQPDARRGLESIVSPLDEQAMIKACNWPGTIRETKAGAWSAPLHYINIPRGDFLYQESRDCPQQQCATEAIKRFAAELANYQAAKEQRWQALAWLCHLVGDLHQPLHAGYADDRGGNNFDIIFRNKPMSLHSFWDIEMINQHAGSWQNLVGQLKSCPLVQAGSDWSAERVNNWTNESHQLAKTMVYPATINIDETYEQQSWELVQKRISLAATRLALIINTKLQNGN